MMWYSEYVISAFQLVYFGQVPRSGWWNMNAQSNWTLDSLLCVHRTIGISATTARLFVKWQPEYYRKYHSLLFFCVNCQEELMRLFVRLTATPHVWWIAASTPFTTSTTTLLQQFTFRWRWWHLHPLPHLSVECHPCPLFSLEVRASAGHRIPGTLL